MLPEKGTYQNILQHYKDCPERYTMDNCNKF